MKNIHKFHPFCEVTNHLLTSHLNPIAHPDEIWLLTRNLPSMASCGWIISSSTSATLFGKTSVTGGLSDIYMQTEHQCIFYLPPFTHQTGTWLWVFYAVRNLKPWSDFTFSCGFRRVDPIVRTDVITHSFQPSLTSELTYNEFTVNFQLAKQA